MECVQNVQIFGLTFLEPQSVGDRFSFEPTEIVKPLIKKRIKLNVYLVENY